MDESSKCGVYFLRVAHFPVVTKLSAKPEMLLVTISLLFIAVCGI